MKAKEVLLPTAPETYKFLMDYLAVHT
jgi:hypothetical protein